MGCAHLLLGLPSDVQGKEETGTGPRALLPLLSSGGSSYAGNLKKGLDFEHGCLLGGRAQGRGTRVGRWVPMQTGDSPDAPSPSFNLA